MTEKVANCSPRNCDQGKSASQSSQFLGSSQDKKRLRIVLPTTGRKVRSQLGNKNVDFKIIVSESAQSMPTVLRIGAFRFHFYSNEGTEPAHIHIRTQEGECKFWLEPAIMLAYNRGVLSHGPSTEWLCIAVGIT